jgi:hypothetical protein
MSMAFSRMKRHKVGTGTLSVLPETMHYKALTRHMRIITVPQLPELAVAPRKHRPY